MPATPGTRTAVGNGATLLDHLGMDRENRRGGEGGGGGREEQKDFEGDGRGGEGRMDGANEGGVRGEHGCERVSV